MQNPSASAEQASTQPGPERTYRGPFTVMTVLFFMWGFMTVFNDILIPRFKEAFTLNYFQAMLVQFAFFGAYFIGALLYYLVSAVGGRPDRPDRLQERRRHRPPDLRRRQRPLLARGRHAFLSAVPRRALRRGPRVRHAADRREPLRDDSRPGAHRVEPPEPGAGVQFGRNDDRAPHRRLPDLPVLREDGRPRRRVREGAVPRLLHRLPRASPQSSSSPTCRTSSARGRSSAARAR